jgi:altronate dehydratase large subunit
LISLGKNPNIGAVLVVGLGCEGVPADKVAEGIAGCGKPVETVVIQETGGFVRSVAQGTLVAQRLAMDLSRLPREPAEVSDIVLGIKCGASDPTSGLASNPATGVVTDRIVAMGGTVLYGEVTEFLGAEHLLARHTASPLVTEELISCVRRLEARVQATGEDLRGGNPTAGNIAGGLSSIEEKSLGAIVKGGAATIQGVYPYGSIPQGKGAFVIDSPGREPELLTGLAAGGANVMVFSTGLGAPQGFPFVPVIKVTGNQRTVDKLPDHIDLSVAGLMDGTMTMDEAGALIFQRVLAVASGEQTKAESIGYSGAVDIWVFGPVI